VLASLHASCCLYTFLTAIHIQEKKDKPQLLKPINFLYSSLVQALALGAITLQDQFAAYAEQEEDMVDDTTAAAADADSASTTAADPATATAAAEDTASDATVDVEQGSGAATTDEQHAAAAAAEVAVAAVADEQVIASLAFMTSIAQLIVALQQYVELDEASESRQLENCTSLEADLSEIEHACTTSATLMQFTKLQSVLDLWCPSHEVYDTSEHDDDDDDDDDEDTMEQ
jgi:cytoskeletal protein RodZ